jgi:hypothetical protein
VAITSAILLLGCAGVAEADFNSGDYSHSRIDCNVTPSRVDPISLVVYGYTAYYAQARAVVQSKTGWSGDNSTGQYGLSEGHCTAMEGESYSGCDICSRLHVRYNQTHSKDAKGRYETVGTPAPGDRHDLQQRDPRPRRRIVHLRAELHRGSHVPSVCDELPVLG